MGTLANSADPDEMQQKMWSAIKVISAIKVTSSGTDLHDTVKPVLSGQSKIDKTKTLLTNGSLTKVQSMAECSLWSILQYIWPASSDNVS